MTKVLDLLASRDQRRRLRLVQWLIASLVYAGTAALLVAGVGQGWMDATALYYWLGFVAAVLVVGYAALRSGWTERFQDPSISLWQLAMGVLAVIWGYLICGPMRTSALFPLMVIFAFGAFALRWRQIAFLTALSLSCLIAAIVVRSLYPQWIPAQGEITPVQLDINNLLMLAVVLPALAVIAARLSGLRQKLHDQRHALAGALSEVERLATTDELTGIANRRSMQVQIDRSVALSSRQITPFSVAIMDIDHFKAVNDELGHAAGDSALKAFACLAGARLRNTDMLGRWGGEEFVLLLPGGPEGVGNVLQRIRESVRNDCLDDRPLTFSSGVAHHRPGESPDALLARADLALYEAKGAGRDRDVTAG